MSIFLILLAAAAGIAVSRLLLGRWFNHLSVYTAIWATSLALFEVRLINYYPLEPETWLMTIAAWLALFLGAVIVAAARFARGIDLQPAMRLESLPAAVLEEENRILVRVLWVYGIIGLLTALQHWSVLIARYGSLTNVLLMANIVYSYLRGTNESPGMVPYLNSFSLAGTLLAGALTASTGRIKLAAVLPLVAVFLSEFATMGRYKLVVAAILFVCGFVLGRRTPTSSRKEALKLFGRRAVAVAAFIALLVGGAEMVRSTRGMVESFQGSSRKLQALKGASFITPSIYLYATVHHGVFNQYLKEDREHSPFGGNTFAPVFRVLAKFGFDTQLYRYQYFYHTPAPANTGTYLREVHADFGVMGVLLFPFVVGLLSTLAWYKMIERFRYEQLGWLGCAFAVIGMSLYVCPTRSGDLIIITAATVLGGRLIDRARTRALGASAEAPSQALP